MGSMKKGLAIDQSVKNISFNCSGSHEIMMSASLRNAQKITAFKRIHTDFKEILKHE